MDDGERVAMLACAWQDLTPNGSPLDESLDHSCNQPGLRQLQHVCDWPAVSERRHQLQKSILNPATDYGRLSADQTFLIVEYGCGHFRAAR